MNKEQRKRIEDLLADLSSVLDEIECIKADEEDKYDNLPEQFQDAEVGERIQDGIDALDDACSYLSDAIDSLGGVC